MKRIALWVCLLMASLSALGADPPANTAYRAVDDKLFVFGTDNDYQAKYDSGDNRLELVDAAGNVLVRVTDGGTTGVLGVVQFDVINGSYASQITSAATAIRAMLIPDRAGTFLTSGDTGTVTSTILLDGTILNADVNASAAIVPTKFSAGTNGQVVVTAGGASGWGTVPSAGITDDTIVDSDINSAAAIGLGKISTGSGSNGQVLTLVAGVWAPAASGSVGGAGPLVDNAIPRMTGTGGATLQGYTDDANDAPVISDGGIVTLKNGLVVQGDDADYAQFDTLTDGAQFLDTPIQFYNDSLTGSELRAAIVHTDNGSETGTFGGNAQEWKVYNTSGSYSHDAMTIYADPALGTYFEGTAGTPRRFLFRGDLYAGITDVQVTSSGKVLWSAIAQNGATTGQVPQWDGDSWEPASSAGSGNVINAGAAADNRVARFNADGQHIQESEVAIDDSGNVDAAGTLTAGSANTVLTAADGTILDAALSSTVANLDQAETISGNWVNTANPWADNEVSDTLTASILIGSGSTTNAVDLATAEVNGLLDSANIDQSLSVATLNTSGNATLGDTTDDTHTVNGTLTTSQSVAGASVWQHFNTNAGTSSEAQLLLGNAANIGESLAIRALGTGFTTSGGFKQDGVALVSGISLGGGLSLISRGAAADVRIYAGGFADSDIVAAFNDDQTAQLYGNTTLGDASTDTVTATGLMTTAASTTTRAGLNIPPGTAPTSPTNGDFWSTTAGFYGQVNGSTVGPFATATSAPALQKSISIIGNVGGGEDTLNTYSLPAGTLATDGDSVLIETVFNFAVSTNARARLYFGATVIYDSGTISPGSGLNVTVVARVTRYGATNQLGVAVSTTSSVAFASNATITLPAETLSGAITIKGTGESGTSTTDDVRQFGQYVQYRQ